MDRPDAQSVRDASVRSLWPYLFLAWLVLLFFGDLLAGGRSFALRDVFINFLPWRVYAHQAMAAGEIPWWNPYGGYGKPFVADVEVGFYYPAHILFLFLPVVTAFKATWMLHLWIAGSSMFALCRSWALRTAASLVAAVAFMFSTFPVAILESEHGLGTIVWTPLVLLLLCRLTGTWAAGAGEPIGRVFRQSAGSVAGLALVTAVQFLAGHTEFFVFSTLFSSVCFLAQCLCRVPPRRIAGALLSAVAAGVLMTGLVLPQLVPTLEMLPFLDRMGTYDPNMLSGSISPRHFLAMVFPFLFGGLGWYGQYWAESVGEFTVGTCYLGILPLLLVPCSLLPCLRRGPRLCLTLSLWLLGVAGLVIAMGRFTPLAPFLYRLPLVTHFRWPSKFNCWIWTAAALLAGLGYQALTGEPADRRARRVRAAFFILIVAAWVLLLISFSGIIGISDSTSRLIGRGGLDAARYAAVRKDVLIGLVFFGTGIALLALRVYTRINRTLVDAMVVGCLFLNLAVIGRQVHPIMPDRVYTDPPRPELLASLKSDEWRVHTFAFGSRVGQLLYGNPGIDAYVWAKAIGTEDCWLPYGIYSTYAAGFKIKRNLEIVEGLDRLRPDQRLLLARVANVGVMLVKPPGQNGEAASDQIVTVAVDKGLPRAFLVNRWWNVDGVEQTAATHLFKDEGYRSGATVEYVPGAVEGLPPPPETGDGAAPPGSPAGIIRVFEAGRNNVHLEVEAPGRSLLVLCDSWYPGWKAYVDYKEQPIYRANIWFRGVFVGKGWHQVNFVYRPTHIDAAFVGCGLSALVVCGLGWMGWRQRRLSFGVVR